MYSRPDVFAVDSEAEPLEIVITLYPFSTSNHEELSFEKDERYLTKACLMLKYACLVSQECDDVCMMMHSFFFQQIKAC